jgi:hypothetical protein
VRSTAGEEAGRGKEAWKPRGYGCRGLHRSSPPSRSDFGAADSAGTQAVRGKEVALV